MHRQFIPCFIVVLFCISNAFSQNPKAGIKHAASIGITDLSLIDQMMEPIPGIGKKTSELIQRQNVKSYMMPVRRVEMPDDELSYIIASCLEFYVNLDRNYKVNLSPDYIALNLRNTGRKVTPQAAFELLANDGTVSAAILPFGSRKLNSGVYATQKYRITNFLHLFRDVTRDRQKTFETRKALLRGHPVIVQLNANDSARDQNNKRYWKISGERDKAMPFIVVGYDELEEAFEITSSWGSHWGENGYIWLSYDEFEKHAVNGYVLVPPQEF